MKIIVAHNLYRSDSPSGENRVVAEEISRLRAAGIETVAYLKSSDDIVGLRQLAEAATGPIYARVAAREFADMLKHEQPSLVHLHNVFPLISPFIVRVAARMGIPIVQTIHNYRLSCVNGLHFRDSQVCVDCLHHKYPWPAIQHSCYRGSSIQTIPMAVSQVIHAGTWRIISRFFALTPFMATHLQKLGVPEGKIVIRPSSVTDPGATVPPGTDIVFIGRLDASKGLLLLLDAWGARRRTTRRLVIVGDGPLASVVQSAAAADPSIRFIGAVQEDGVKKVLRHASGLIAPSLWYEGFPLTIVEAFSHGRPVVVTNVGSAGSVVDNTTGWVIRPTMGDLVSVIDRWDENDAAARGQNARRRYLAEFTPEVAQNKLIDTYKAVLKEAGRRE